MAKKHHQAKRSARKRGKKQAGSSSSTRSKRAGMRQASTWPLRECLITKAWREPSTLVQIAVVRESPLGEIAVAGFLVDLGCLGVKNAMAISFPTAHQYREQYRSHLTASQIMIPCELDLAAKVIDEGIKYAESLGFKPHRDIKDAFLIMGEAYPERCDEVIPLGQDGQPFFIAGPYDNVDRILNILNKNVGPDNYHYLIPLGDPDFEDEWDDLDEDEEWYEADV